MGNFESIFTDDTLHELFPPARANDFFEALFGDANEGSYDIALSFKGHDGRTGTLCFYLDLHERPGCCLACNLTYGLPEVFSRHPVINIKGLVDDIEKKLAGAAACDTWNLGSTVQRGKSLHSIPLNIYIGSN